METIGELEVNRAANLGSSELGFAVEWRIKEFFSLSPEVGYFHSPTFSFDGASWLLRIYPNGLCGIPDGFIHLFLRRETSGPPIRLDFDLGLKNFDGKINPEEHFTQTFAAKQGCGKADLISRSQLLERKFELVPSDILSLVCRIRHPASPDISSNTATEKCSYCKSTLDAHENLSSHQQKCMNKPIKCPECSDVVALKDWYGHKCQRIGPEACEKLSNDFKTIMLSGDLSDIVIKVKGHEFRLHRSILAARNSYFYSMLKTDMKEKSSGIVTIEDCEPDIFHSFIHYVYTGKVDKLSSENVCDLYEAADKYQEDQLKNECLHFMKNTLSSDSFCDYFAMALRHDEKELFQKAIELFITKGKEIARSVKWQAFVQKHPIQANELFIKTLDHYIK